MAPVGIAISVAAYLAQVVYLGREVFEFHAHLAPTRDLSRPEA